jgi:hypothetical protein
MHDMTDKAKVTEVKEVKEAVLDPYQTDVELPSLGKFYDGRLPDGKITIRPIKVSEEKLLAGGGNRMRLVDKVLERCMITKTLPLRDMIISDKFWLMLNLRAISYGSDYMFMLKCSACSMEFRHSLTLPTGLQLKRATDADKEPFDVKLPVAKKTVSLRFLRGSDEEEIERYLKQLPRNAADEGDPAYVYRLSRFIVKVDGKELDTLEKMNFCDGLIGQDSLAIRRAIAENETGPILTIQTQCPGCKADVETSLPLTNEFFPSSAA